MTDLSVRIVLTSENRTNRGVRGAERGLDRLTRKGRKLSKLDLANRAARDVNELSANLARTGHQLTKVGRLGQTAIRSVLEPTVAYGAAVAEVSTLVDDAAFSQEKIREITQDLSREYGGLPTDQAKALYQTISAGATSSADATELLTVANRLAVGGVTDVETAVDGLTTVLNSYADPTLTAAQVSDSMFVAMRAGKTTIGQMSGAIGKVTPLASTLGVSFDEVGASLAVLTAGGLNTREATTALRSALSGIIKPTDDARKTARGLGISFDKAGKMGVIPFLQQIGEMRKEGKITDKQLAKLFPNIRGLGAVLTATGEGGGAKFVDVLEQMKNKSGETSKAYGKMTNTLSFKSKKAAAQVDLLKIQIGDQLAPVAVDLLKEFQPMFEEFAAFVRDNPSTVKEFAKLVVVGTALATALGPVLTTISAISGVVGAFRVAKMSAQLGDLAGQGAGLSRAARGMSGISKAAGALAVVGAGVGLGMLLSDLLGITGEIERLNAQITKLKNEAEAEGIESRRDVDFDIADFTEEEDAAFLAATMKRRSAENTLASGDLTQEEKAKAVADIGAAESESDAVLKSMRTRNRSVREFDAKQAIQGEGGAGAAFLLAQNALTGKAQEGNFAGLRIVVDQRGRISVEPDEAESNVDVTVDSGAGQ